MKPNRLKPLLFLILSCVAGGAVAQVRIGQMRGLKHGKQVPAHEAEAMEKKRRVETVQVKIKPAVLPETRKEMDAVFYVPWNEKKGLFYDDFLCNKNLYNKFLPAKDTDLTKVVYPDYRAFYKKLNERIMAEAPDDIFLHQRIEMMLTDSPDSITGEYMPMPSADSNYIFSISIDSPAASVITISPVIYAINEGAWYYNITALFNRNESWMIVKSKDILAHEQIHFDIFELYARKMRKLLMETLRRSYAEEAMGNITNEIAPEFEQLYQQLNEKQLDFDRETMKLTSANEPLQSTNLKWKKALKQEMEELKQFETAEGTVMLSDIVPVPQKR